MKTLLTTALLSCLSIIFVACGSDDSNPPETDIDVIDPALFAPLLGDWVADSKTLTGCNNQELNGEYTCQAGTITCIALNFQEDDLYGGGYFFFDVDATGEFTNLTTSGAVQSLSSTSFTLCQPNLFGESTFNCTHTFNYELLNNNTTLEVTWTDEDLAGCTSSATFTKSI